MSTPDIIISICNLVFIPALFPMIFSPLSEKPPLLSSIPTALGLYVMSFTFLSISLLFSTVVSFLSATAWLFLAVQRIKFLRINK